MLNTRTDSPRSMTSLMLNTRSGRNFAVAGRGSPRNNAMAATGSSFGRISKESWNKTGFTTGSAGFHYSSRGSLRGRPGPRGPYGADVEGGHPSQLKEALSKRDLDHHARQLGAQINSFYPKKVVRELTAERSTNGLLVVGRLGSPPPNDSSSSRGAMVVAGALPLLRGGTSSKGGSAGGQGGAAGGMGMAASSSAIAQRQTSASASPDKIKRSSTAPGKNLDKRTSIDKKFPNLSSRRANFTLYDYQNLKRRNPQAARRLLSHLREERIMAEKRRQDLINIQKRREFFARQAVAIREGFHLGETRPKGKAKHDSPTKSTGGSADATNINPDARPASTTDLQNKRALPTKQVDQFSVFQDQLARDGKEKLVQDQQAGVRHIKPSEKTGELSFAPSEVGVAVTTVLLTHAAPTTTTAATWLGEPQHLGADLWEQSRRAAGGASNQPNNADEERLRKPFSSSYSDKFVPFLKPETVPIGIRSVSEKSKNGSFVVPETTPVWNTSRPKLLGMAERRQGAAGSVTSSVVLDDQSQTISPPGRSRGDLDSEIYVVAEGSTLSDEGDEERMLIWDDKSGGSKIRKISRKTICWRKGQFSKN